MKHVDTILLVEDIQRSKEFYLKVLGLEVLHDWDVMIVFKERFAIHQVGRLLPENEAAQFCRDGKQGRGNVIVYFEADNLDVVYQEMQAQKVNIVHGIVRLPMQRIFRIADPDGYIIEIGEPI